ncbi:FAD-dependent oxidoreductase [Neomoorella carbonis]|jgi:2,4-dienoyl-CoA reductase-like NADH-dependent reductase (Old Yellow Enzyme family)/thioredoxin reductase|uniref:oxidoreductase n=1 Tax=Neomoorella carbonis TaxID=3062783 RepID=UPI003254DBBA
MGKYKYTKLFEPWLLGKALVPNRIVMAPMGALLVTEEGFISERAIKFYEDRAAGGAGLIVIENSCVEWPRGKANIAQTRTDTSKAITGLRALSERVQYYGSLIAAQLQHAGGQTTLERTENTQPYAASAIPMKGKLIPTEMTKDDIAHVIQCFARSAQITKQAGFDCVEIHGAHGYLVSQFLSPVLNHRRDEYGGDAKGRVRFAVELIDAIRKTVGTEFPIIFRFNGSDRVQGGVTVEETRYIARALEEAGVSALSISSGLNSLSRDWVFPIELHPRGCNVEFAYEIKKAVNIPVGVAGRIDSPDYAEEIIREGKADFVVIGRPMIAEPQWGKKAFMGKTDQIRPCLYCNNGCTKHHHNNWRLSCDINVEAGRELEWQIKPNASRSLRLAIVGGGPAGMEAARRARLRGHNVQLFEKEDQLGGQLKIAGIAAHKKRILEYLQYMNREMKRLGVDVHCSTPVTLDLIKKLEIDGLIVATGAVCKPLSDLRVYDERMTRSAWDVFLNGIGTAREVAIIGGGHVGVDLALHLTSSQNPPSVRIIEIQQEILPGAEPGTKMALLRALYERGVEVFTSATAGLSPNKDKVVITSVNGDSTWERPVDLIVGAIGANSYAPPEFSAENLLCPVIYVGDCIKPRGIWEATHEGSYAILQLEMLNNI